MKIEIAKPERMSQSGSSLLRLIQNNDMPILDLLVRESIQNSLDADSGDYNDIIVKFITDRFNSNEFCNELESVGEKLNKKFPGSQNEFLAIRDYHTVGLTGVMNYNEVKDNNYGNLLKLVYEISKPQSGEGAGGSWGLGKTVYFRVGIGLVVYYSRIRLDDGCFQSRLAVTFVEDENSKNSIIPSYGKQNLKRGIAWWGRQTGENQTEPITNEVYINKILNIFHLTPYQNDDTGTTVIIPFINSEKLLKNNITDKDDNNKPIHLYWLSSVKEYLKVAVKRWYSPRLDNPLYPNGRYLHVTINGENITNDEMEPSYRIIQQLYNKANNDNVDFDDTRDIDLYKIKIRLRNVLKSSVSGTLCAVKVSKKFLHMDPPDNYKSPYMYYNCDVKSMNANKSIICFTRKPGMIVSYHTVGDWAEGLPETDLDHYILAIFVLNSENTLKNLENLSLEEYIRKSEMADHTDWNDYSIHGINPRIIKKSQKQIISKISDHFSGQENKPDHRKDVGLGRMLGKMFLPPEDFGHAPSREAGNSFRSQTRVIKHKNINLIIYPNDTKYSMNYMKLHLRLKSKSPSKGVLINLAIDSESGSIGADEWEEDFGLEMPFYILNVEKISIGNKEIKEILEKNERELYLNDVKCSLKLNETKSKYCTPYQIEIEYMEPEKYDFDMYVKIFIKDKSTKPVFTINELEGEING